MGKIIFYFIFLPLKRERERERDLLERERGIYRKRERVQKKHKRVQFYTEIKKSPREVKIEILFKSGAKSLPFVKFCSSGIMPKMVHKYVSVICDKIEVRLVG